MDVARQIGRIERGSACSLRLGCWQRSIRDGSAGVVHGCAEEGGDLRKCLVGGSWASREPPAVLYRRTSMWVDRYCCIRMRRSWWGDGCVVLCRERARA